MCLLFTLAVFAAAADDGGSPRNALVLVPAGGVTITEGSVDDGFAGLGLAYTRFLGERFGIGLKPTLTVTGLGTPNARPNYFDMELFVEFRPFLALHGLYTQTYLKSLAFSFGRGQPPAFDRFVGGARVGFDLPLGGVVGVNVGVGAELTATPSGVTAQPTATIGLSLSF